MSLTEDMKAALEVLGDKLSAGGLTKDEVTAQIHTVVDPEIANLKAALDANTTSDASADAKLADLNGAVSAFISKFTPAAPEPAPVETPVEAPAEPQTPAEA